MNNLISLVVSLEQVLSFYADKCLKGRLIETIVDTSKNKVVFELFKDKENKDE